MLEAWAFDECIQELLHPNAMLITSSFGSISSMYMLYTTVNKKCSLCGQSTIKTWILCEVVVPLSPFCTPFRCDRLSDNLIYPTHNSMLSRYCGLTIASEITHITFHQGIEKVHCSADVIVGVWLAMVYDITSWWGFGPSDVTWFSSMLLASITSAINWRIHYDQLATILMIPHTLQAGGDGIDA